MDRRAENRRCRIIDGVVFAVLLAAASAVTLTLFYRQTMAGSSLYRSDMKAYILEMQGLDSGYSFPYPIFFKLSALIHLFVGPELSVAIATMLLNSLAIVVTKLAFNYILLPDLWGCSRSGKRNAAVKGNTGEGVARTGNTGVGIAVKGNAGEGVARTGNAGGSDARKGNAGVGDAAECNDGKGVVGKGGPSWQAGVAISLAVVSLFFISMLFPPKGIYLPGIKFTYLGVFSANPFHNATYMAARPFAILAFLWYVKLLPVYEKGIAGRGGAWGDGQAASRGAVQGAVQGAAPADYVLFSLFLLLATMTKPSFTLVMVSTAGLIMLYRLFKSGFCNFVPTVQLGICFIPTFLDLLYQYRGVFVREDGGEGGIGFCLGEVWADYCDNIPLAVCLAVGFPLLVLVLNRKECRKNTLFAFAWQLYLVGFAETFFLYEKGFRKVDFNFSWGYMCGIFFCHFGALLLLLSVTGRRLTGKTDGGGRTAAHWFGVAALILQWLAYFWHVACGLYYFGTLLSGEIYY